MAVMFTTDILIIEWSAMISQCVFVILFYDYFVNNADVNNRLQLHDSADLFCK